MSINSRFFLKSNPYFNDQPQPLGTSVRQQDSVARSGQSYWYVQLGGKVLESLAPEKWYLPKNGLVGGFNHPILRGKPFVKMGILHPIFGVKITNNRNRPPRMRSGFFVKVADFPRNNSICQIQTVSHNSRVTPTSAPVKNGKPYLEWMIWGYLHFQGAPIYSQVNPAINLPGCKLRGLYRFHVKLPSSPEAEVAQVRVSLDWPVGAFFGWGSMVYSKKNGAN